MNKAELVDAVATAANLSKADAGRAVDAVVNSITASLKKGQQVAVVGFGTFGVKPGLPARVATRAPVKRSRSPRRTCPGSRLARHSRMP